MNASGNLLYERLERHSNLFHKVVPFQPSKDKLFHFDFTGDNKELIKIDLADTGKFSEYVEKTLKREKAKYGIGGYNENRILYKRSTLFDKQLSHRYSEGQLPARSKESVRNIHLGIDIWGKEGTKVYAPLGGMIHSFAFNDNFGDYGATIILLHQLEGFPFYTLYGHLSLKDIANLKEGKYISRGEVVGHFGKPNENGHWPPHLHFQIINDMRVYKGDYPGVCSVHERKKYLNNCPNPDVILGMMEYANPD